MHRKYAQAGFEAVSVSLDDPADKEVMAKVLKFLQGKEAAFTNVVLDEKPELWQEKLQFDGPPCVFVFNREGKWTRFTPGFDYGDVEKLVTKYMAEK
jgi:hypothetical protein